MIRLLTSCFRRASLSPRRFSSSGVPTIKGPQRVEEESLPEYAAAGFYDVRIGQVFNSRYQVVGKLGYGANSTVWLSRDLISRRYATLKIYNKTSAQFQGNREVQVYKHLSTIRSTHEGQRYIRTILDSFELNEGSGCYQCLVHKPLWISLFKLQRLNSSHRFTEDLLRGTLMCLFEALDYLHTECHVIHTDIKAGNILQEIEDDSILKDFENAELENPSPWKDVEGRAIYLTRKLGRPKVFGRPVLCDFGQARSGNDENDDLIQPKHYRAPEVILEMKWSYSADIWNVGVMIWDLFEDKHLFNGIDPEEQEYSHRGHLAEMIAYIGLPPLELLCRSKVSSNYFDEDGVWNTAIDIPKGLSLENSEENLDGRKKELFLQFMRKMLCWVPEERKTARELLKDPWLNGITI
ncbi:hypothetical protein MMC11_002642 [Xylographa trunciseda]|nr:hypothetical protein [Xylographa trunciseda]